MSIRQNEKIVQARSVPSINRQPGDNFTLSARHAGPLDSVAGERKTRELNNNALLGSATSFSKNAVTNRSRLFWYLVIAALFTTAAATSPDELFAAQKWNEALVEYQKEADPLPSTLQRMGQCALQAGKLPEAALYWRRAQKSMRLSNYLLLSRLVAAVQQQAGVAPPPHAAYAMISDGLCAVPLLWWQLLFLLLWALLLWRGMRLYRTGRWGWLGALLMCMLIIGIIITHGAACRRQMSAIVMKTAPLYAGPSQRYTQLKTLTPASQVTVLEMRKMANQPFYKVTQGHARGWVDGDQLGHF